MFPLVTTPYMESGTVLKYLVTKHPSSNNVYFSLSFLFPLNDLCADLKMQMWLDDKCESRIFFLTWGHIYITKKKFIVREER